MALGGDAELDTVVAHLKRLDPGGDRTALVLRDTLDQLYDGQHTGRYRWDQLHKTEKTHCGTLVEINMHRAFEFADGGILDYQVAGIEVDCKYSQDLWGWMIPIEARGRLCLVLTANDHASTWSMGVVRTTDDILGAPNRDGKASILQHGRSRVAWLFEDEALPPNVLLQLPRADVERIMAGSSGAARVRDLFRVAQRRRVGRGVVATVAQQADYMKRVRENGGARTTLRPEGIIILGQYDDHRELAEQLGLPIPERGESVSARVTQARPHELAAAEIESGWWRLASEADPLDIAPVLPTPRSRRG